MCDTMERGPARTAPVMSDTGGRRSEVDSEEVYPIILPRVPKKQRISHQKIKTFKPYKLYCSSDSESNSDEESPTQPVVALSKADSDVVALSKAGSDVDVLSDEEEPDMPQLEGEEQPPSFSPLSQDSDEWEKIVPSGTKEKTLRLKRNDVIRYKENTGVSWTRALVIGRAGKTSGVNKNKFNLQLDGGESEEPLCDELASVYYVERHKS